jgi:hypothetical protein
MASGDVAVELAAAVGQTLPVAYLHFLDRLPARPTLGDGPIFDFGGQQWRPHDRSKLAETIPHRRRESGFPYAHEMARHAEMLRAADAVHGGEASSVLVDQGFTLDRLARGFCVGDDGNGEPLFVDLDTGGVFAYYQDGMDVEQWAPTLAELVAGSLDWLGDEDA